MRMELYPTPVIILNLRSVQPQHLDATIPQPTEDIFKPIQSRALIKRDSSHGAISRRLVNQLLRTHDKEHISFIGISWTFATSIQTVQNTHLKVEAEPIFDLILCTFAEPCGADPSPKPSLELRTGFISGCSMNDIQINKLNHRGYLNTMAANNHVRLISERSAQDFASILREIHRRGEMLGNQPLDRRRTIEMPESYPASRASTPSSLSDAFSGTDSLPCLRDMMYRCSEREPSLGNSSIHSWELVDHSKSSSPIRDVVIKQEEDPDEFAMPS